jgi:hypothetical protein
VGFYKSTNDSKFGHVLDCVCVSNRTDLIEWVVPELDTIVKECQAEDRALPHLWLRDLGHLVAFFDKKPPVSGALLRLVPFVSTCGGCLRLVERLVATSSPWTEGLDATEMLKHERTRWIGELLAYRARDRLSTNAWKQ